MDGNEQVGAVPIVPTAISTSSTHLSCYLKIRGIVADKVTIRTIAIELVSG